MAMDKEERKFFERMSKAQERLAEAQEQMTRVQERMVDAMENSSRVKLPSFWLRRRPLQRLVGVSVLLTCSLSGLEEVDMLVEVILAISFFVIAGMLWTMVWQMRKHEKKP